MAAEDVVKVTLDLDDKEFVSKLQNSIGLFGELGKSSKLSELSGVLTTIGVTLGIVAAAALAVKGAIDLAVEAEHITQINNSFEAMAVSAGLSADAIRNDLVGAAKGLADDTDLLLAATRAITMLGGNAVHLGETMDIARKATVLFGGEMLSNFERINQALATGNARALKQFGIIVDTDKAQKEYAKSIGVSVEYLNDAGKKQAFLNAALEQAKQKFAGVDESSLKTTNNLQKISVALNQIRETAVMAWDKLAGPTVSAAISGLAAGVNILSNQLKSLVGTQNEQKEAQRELLNQTIEQNEKLLEHAKNNKLGSEMIWQYTTAIKSAKKALEKLNEEDEKALQLSMKKAARSWKPEDAPVKSKKLDTVDYEKLEADRAKRREERLKAEVRFEKDLIDLQKNRLAEQERIATTIDEIDLIHLQKREQLEAESQNKLDQLKRDYVDKKIITDEQYSQARFFIEEATAAKIQQLEEGLQEARINAMERAAATSKSAMMGITATFAVESAKAKRDLQDYGKLGQVVFGSFKNNAVKAFQSLGDGSKSAGEAMKGFVFGAIADIAEAHGQMMLAAGLWPPNPVAIAGGGALIALAAALRSQSQGSSKGIGGGGGSAGAGGGATAAGSNTNQTATEMAQAETKPTITETQKKSVSINIAGSYYETEQTRTKLMDMIREAGDFTDFNLKQIGQK